MLNGNAKYGNLNFSRMLLKALHMNWLEIKMKLEFFYETPFITLNKNWRLSFYRINYSNKYLTNDPITINIHKILVLSIQNTTGNKAEKTVPTSTALNGATPFRTRAHIWIWKTWNSMISNIKHRWYFWKAFVLSRVLVLVINTYQFNNCANGSSNNTTNSYLPVW